MDVSVCDNDGFYAQEVLSVNFKVTQVDTEHTRNVR